ncbi:SCO4848 family membrane protein [Microbacterium sp. gxy059]|uniref:SCO4848 family membrane protein n=1 Tax=Microbacterium sp. gxy059 TaxID=2957199 RepID=UPI003D98954D
MIALSVLLFVNAAFNLFAWPAFLRRVVRDPRARDTQGRVTRFLTVHIVLVTFALVLAVVSALAGVAALVGAL